MDFDGLEARADGGSAANTSVLAALPVGEHEDNTVFVDASDADASTEATAFQEHPPQPPEVAARPESLAINAAAAAAAAAPAQMSPPYSSATSKHLLYIKTANDSPSSLHSERARHQHTRKVTRDIAALDFLQNIPMRSESLALAHSYHSHHHQHYYQGGGHPSPPKWATSASSSHPSRVAFKIKTTAASNPANNHNHSHPQEDHDAPEDPGDPEDEFFSTMDGNAMDNEGGYTNRDEEGLAGRRLPGFEAKIVHLPPLFRYRMTTKFPAASAVVRRWENMTTQQGILDSRVFFSRACGYPLAASTLIKYNGSNETMAPPVLPRKRFLSVSGLGGGGSMELTTNTSTQQYYDWRGKSYYRLLHATWTPCDKDRDSQDDHPVLTPYAPNYLDDPEFRQGRHRHVVRGDKNIGPLVSSILLFVKPHELKEELNKKFREKHTWLHDNELSLSKIRNLKRETLTTAQRVDMEIATVALACVYFEKLVLSHYVNKANRKLYMSVCLLLATKFNEPKSSDAMKTLIKQILADVDVTHSIPSREVLTTEFTVYAQLSFSLHVPLTELHPHFTRLLKMVESNPRKYLDDDVFTEYSNLILDAKLAQDLILNLNNNNAETVLSVDGETQDEGTDVEALMSDEDMEDDDGGDHGDGERREEDRGDNLGGGGGGDHPSSSRRRSLPPWSRIPSFSQWWKERPWEISSKSQPLQEDQEEAEEE